MMSIRAIPLIVFAFILYNIVVLLGGTPTAADVTALGAGSDAEVILRKGLFTLPLVTAKLRFTWGDIIILVTMILLFVELMKSTYTSSVSLVDHGLSMLVFIACLIEFLLMKEAASTVFFFIMVAALIDVVAGYSIGIRVARRDLNIGGGGM